MPKGQNRPTRRHHIVPRLLLKRFAKDAQVWVTNRINESSYCTNINDAACVVDYYTVETTGEVGLDCVEKGLLAKVENLVEPVIDKMLQSWALPKGAEWNILVNFLALMYFRGPVFRSILQRGHEYGASVVEEHIHSSEERWKAIVSELCQIEEIDIDYEEALRARKEIEFQVDLPNTYHVQEMLDFASGFVPVFAEMTPNIERINTIFSDAKFVISDCPIVPIPRNANPPKEWRWFRNPNADLYFPVSSKACLVLNYDKLRKVSDMKRARVAFVNHVMALNSERVIISEEHNFVWHRQNGTIATSHQELLEFLAQSSEGGPVARIDYDLLRKRIIKALEKREAGDISSE